MKTKFISFISAVTVCFTISGWAGGENVKPLDFLITDMGKKYVEAEKFLSWNISKLVKNTSVKPHWLTGKEAFWYLRQTDDGHQYVMVDAATGKRKPAFNHTVLAGLLAKKTGEVVVAENLPFYSIEIEAGGGYIDFSYKEKYYRFDPRTKKLEAHAPLKTSPNELLSPDKQWAVYRKENNIWLRNVETGEERPLTTDGIAHYAYAKSPDATNVAVSNLRKGRDPVIALWSPDSTRLFTYRLDERQVEEFTLIETIVPTDENSFARPNLYRYRYPIAGDKHIAGAELMVFDIRSGKRINAEYPSLLVPYASFVELEQAWWSTDGRHVYFIRAERGERQVTLCEFDTDTGKVREIVKESNDTFVELNLTFKERPNVRVLDESREVIWFSERDGWGHLYLYDLDSGKLKNRITKGEWLARSILHVDEDARTVIFSANGREPDEDPYFRHVYRINLDGTGLDLLTPEVADHDVALWKAPVNFWETTQGRPVDTAFGMSPSGKYFVETYGRIGVTHTSVLRNNNGDIIAELEKTDTDKLMAAGYVWPEPFKVKDRNGEYDLYGNIFVPSDMTPGQKYPVIDLIYPGPQVTRTPKLPFDWPWGTGALALSRLGLVVITVDGLGSPYRSKAFHDKAFGNLQDAGLPDHIAAVQQLAEERPYMDLDRVGISGGSGGGYATIRAMLAFPNFYKVGVASAAYDPSNYGAFWTEKYQGPRDRTDYSVTSSVPLAMNLQGKLLLSYGNMDDNAHFSSNTRLIDAFIRQNKDIDILLSPNASHGGGGNPGYATRRTWDYFVKHLMGVDPPENYSIALPK